jgi:hypothetical protein
MQPLGLSVTRRNPVVLGVGSFFLEPPRHRVHVISTAYSRGNRPSVDDGGIKLCQVLGTVAVAFNRPISSQATRFLLTEIPF